MPQISSKRIKHTDWERMWERWLHSVRIIHRHDELETLMFGMFTETERVMFAKRLTAFLLLLSEWPVKTVAEDLNLSTATVYKFKIMLEKDTHLSNMLQELFPIKIPFKDMENQATKLDDFFDDLEDFRDK